MGVLTQKNRTVETGISPVANIPTPCVWCASTPTFGCGMRTRSDTQGVSDTGRCGFPKRNKKRETEVSLFLFGAGNGNRTRTVKPHAPQTCASASSATRAGTVNIIHYKIAFVNPFFEIFYNFFKKILRGIFSSSFPSFCPKNLAFFYLLLYNIEKKIAGGVLCVNIPITMFWKY